MNLEDFDWKNLERIALLTRTYYFKCWSDDEICLSKIGIDFGFKEFKDLEEKYEHINYEELIRMEFKLLYDFVSKLSDEEFLGIFTKYPPKHGILSLYGVNEFRGNHYIARKKGSIKLGSAWNDVKQNVLYLLNETSEERSRRLYAILKALCELCFNVESLLNPWFGADRKETWKKIEEILGETYYPSGADFADLSMRGLYYRVSDRYCIPFEIIPVVKQALEEWEKSKEVEKVSKSIPVKVEKAVSIEKSLHSQIQNMLVKLGELLGYEVKKEYPDPQGLYRYDVVWFKKPSIVPLKIFEIQVGGDVDRALARLKHALDVWGKPDLFLIVAKTEDFARIQKLVGDLLKGAFHELAGNLIIMEADDVKIMLEKPHLRKLVS